jgi:hypothetical protein
MPNRQEGYKQIAEVFYSWDKKIKSFRLLRIAEKCVLKIRMC